MRLNCVQDADAVRDTASALSNGNGFPSPSVLECRPLRGLMALRWHAVSHASRRGLVNAALRCAPGSVESSNVESGHVDRRNVERGYVLRVTYCRPSLRSGLIVSPFAALGLR